MRLLPSLTPFALGAAAALTLCLPFIGAGCGQTACITLTHAELASGSCPSNAAASARFGASSDCPGMIQSVEGEGIRDGNFCCYAVTAFDDNSFIDCGFSGAGGFGGFGGFGGAGGFGGSGTGGSCQLCQNLFQGVPIDPSFLCPGPSALAFMDLIGCSCSAESSCATSCTNTLCFGISPDDSCMSCLFSDMTCSAAIESCNLN